MRENTACGCCTSPSRPLNEYMMTCSRVTESTSLSGWSSGFVDGVFGGDTEGGARSGSVVSICTRMIPAVTDASRNSIRFVTMSR